VWITYIFFFLIFYFHSIYDFQSLFGGGGSAYFTELQQQQQQLLAQQQHQQQLAFYEPKIAEQFNSRRSRSSLLNILARNYKTVEKITLYLAFFINVILLFHRVDIVNNNEKKDNIAQIEALHKGKGGDDDNDEDEEGNVLETIYIVS